MEINELLKKPLWQMTGEEFVTLHAYACSVNNNRNALRPAVSRVTGVRALAESLACCESKIYELLREGALNDAVISRIGKKIVFDENKARELAAEYTMRKRLSRKQQKYGE